MNTIVSETVELEDGVHGSHAIDARPCMVGALGEHTEDDPRVLTLPEGALPPCHCSRSGVLDALGYFTAGVVSSQVIELLRSRR